MKETIRPKTNLFLLATQLILKGKMYKQDMLFYAYKICNDKNNASHLLGELIKRDIIKIEEIEIGKKSRKKKVQIVSLSQKGENILLSFYHHPRSLYENIARRFDVSSTASLIRQLNINHVKTLFNYAGFNTDFPFKPSLMQLHCRIARKNYSPEDNSLYPFMTDTDIDSLLEKGIFYDDLEYREFYRQTSNDTIGLKSSFRGIFIQKDKCFVIYSNGKNNYNMVYIEKINNETKIYDSLISNSLATQRNLSALTISDSNSFIYATATGRSAGKDKKNKTIPPTLLTIHSKLLDTSSSAYLNDIISVVYGEQGARHLKYIALNNLNTHRLNALDFANRSKQIIPSDDKETPIRYLSNKQSIPCFYIPVYALKTLVEIKSLAYDPVIICNPDMIEAIARITRKQLTYLDSSSLQILNKDNLLIYDKKGYPKGKKMLEDYLHNMDLTIDLAQFNNLPSIYNLDYVDFYNSIANGDIKIEKLLPLLTTKPYVPFLRHKKPNKSIKIDTDTYNYLKDYATNNNISIYLSAKRMINHFKQNENSKDEAYEE